jgi:inosine-uridine nucleoside N-ribohydrolase
MPLSPPAVKARAPAGGNGKNLKRDAQSLMDRGPGGGYIHTERIRNHPCPGGRERPPLPGDPAMHRPLASLAVAAFLAACAGGATAADAEAKVAAPRVPVILDTDIGDDIDDTWALAMLLKCPQLDLRLVTTTFGKSEYRAKLIAKLLEVAKRTDVPVGKGAGGKDGIANQQPWVQDYDLAKYPGKVHEDGVQALIDTVMGAPRPITIISIGPSSTVAAALEKQPAIAAKAVFVGMQGSVRVGYDGSKTPCPEWNVKAAIPAGKKALLAPWARTVITPLDTCGLIRLSGERFQTLVKSEDPLVKALLENYRIWAKKKTVEELKGSSILFDTVAVYLALPGEKPHVAMEDLAITVDDKGMTLIDSAGAKMSVATAWKDKDGYNDLLVQILTR